MNPQRRKKVIILLLILGVALTLWGINYPFVGLYNTNNNYLSLAAKNYQRFGFTNLKFLPTYFAGQKLPSAVPYYLHHPILIFILSAIPMYMFHFQNWSVHATNLLFMLGAVVMIFLIAGELWGRRVAMWSLALPLLFPAYSFFWKYIFFEQGSLFLNLVIYYFFIKYIKKQSARTLLFIFVFSLLSGFIDWGVLYLLFPISTFFFTDYRKRIIRPFIVYLAGAGISLGLFNLEVYNTVHSLTEMTTAIVGRSYTGELTSLSLWPVRLLLISLLRAILYFTPLSAAAVTLFIQKMKRGMKLPELTLLFFFIYGSLNLFFLPTATWGHSYFLYYFVPFFAFAGGLFLGSIEKKPFMLWTWVAVIVASGIGVNYLKIQQVQKQLWKYDIAVNVNRTLQQYETIGVVNFAGDVFENYFLHPSQPILYGQISEWLAGKKYPNVSKAVFVCAGTCTAGEIRQAAVFADAGLVTTYQSGANEAWLITKHTKISLPPVTEMVTPESIPQVSEGNIILKIYRFLRDTLNVGQI